MNEDRLLHDFLRSQTDPLRAAAMFAGPAPAAARYADAAAAARLSAVEQAYPTVAGLMGGDAFAALARGFARDTPALHWDLNAYGAELGAWIRRRQPDAGGDELAEVAALDWAMHRAAFADDFAPLDRVALAGLAADEQPDLRLRAHPATALCVSARPIAALWSAARDGTATVLAGPQTVLVGRDFRHRVWWRPLAAAEAALMACLLAGGRLADGLDAALAHDRGFDLAERLTAQLDEQVWIDLMLPARGAAQA